MNYLKNRYPFKLLTNIFRIATRSSNALQNHIEIKRNSSDSVLKKASQDNLQLKKSSSVSVAKSKDIENVPSSNNLTATESCNSLRFSKTSSEHSILNKNNYYFDTKYDKEDSSKGGKNNLENELKAKLKKLKNLSPSEFPSKEVLSEENRCGLKRAYPWQNLNLRTISQAKDEKTLSKSLHNNNLNKRSSDHSMTTISNPSVSNSSSNQSLRSFKSLSFTSLDRKGCREDLEDIKNRMPLFKSIMKNSDRKSRPVKEVTFNNISSIYTPRISYSSVKQDSNLSVNSCVRNDTKCPIKKKAPASNLGRYEPLKEENSFLHLYNSKRQKTL